MSGYRLVIELGLRNVLSLDRIKLVSGAFLEAYLEIILSNDLPELEIYDIQSRVDNLMKTLS